MIRSDAVDAAMSTKILREGRRLLPRDVNQLSIGRRYKSCFTCRGRRCQNDGGKDCDWKAFHGVLQRSGSSEPIREPSWIEESPGVQAQVVWHGSVVEPDGRSTEVRDDRDETAVENALFAHSGFAHCGGRVSDLIPRPVPRGAFTRLEFGRRFVRFGGRLGRQGAARPKLEVQHMWTLKHWSDDNSIWVPSAEADTPPQSL
jgi:hypothetical protein